MVFFALIARLTFRASGERFRIVGWAALAGLLITGVINLYYRGLFQSDLFNGTYWRTRLDTCSPSS